MIKLKRIRKTYGERTVVDIEQLTFRKGETVAIAGPNGSGKSTLIKIIADVLSADEGSVQRYGKMLYMPQQSIPFKKTVRKNILFSMADSTDKQSRCDEIMKQLRLTELSEKNAKGLSGGECQRLSLARVLANDGDFLILDEPASAADIESTETIENAIKNYKEKTGCGVIMSTHSPVQAMKLADRIIMLCDGKVVEDGSPEELMNSPKTDWGRKFISMWVL